MDLVSAHEAGLDGVDDPELLDRVAVEGRVLVSHDRRTMLDHFRARLAAGKAWRHDRSVGLHLGTLRSD